MVRKLVEGCTCGECYADLPPGERAVTISKILEGFWDLAEAIAGDRETLEPQEIMHRLSLAAAVVIACSDDVDRLTKIASKFAANTHAVALQLFKERAVSPTDLGSHRLQ